MSVSMKPRRKERRIARANLRTLAKSRGRRQLAIRADGGSGFEGHLAGGRDSSTQLPVCR